MSAYEFEIENKHNDEFNNLNQTNKFSVWWLCEGVLTSGQLLGTDEGEIVHAVTQTIWIIKAAEIIKVEAFLTTKFYERKSWAWPEHEGISYECHVNPKNFFQHGKTFTTLWHNLKTSPT